jgi:LPXTG-site transpeptidase (sortase) family protein
MKLIIFSKQRFFLILGIVLLFSLGPFTCFLFSNSNQNHSIALGKLAQAELSTLSIGKPVRLKIPNINIDASIKNVGLTPLGEMDVPKDPRNVSWFDLGPRPGENGSAVIAGHYGWKDNVPAVFDNLYKLKQGDKLYIEDENGATSTFVVRGSKRYDPKADALEIFNLDDKKSHLNLITCEGTWNKVTQSYSSRLVVFTDKVEK